MSKVVLFVEDRLFGQGHPAGLSRGFGLVCNLPGEPISWSPLVFVGPKNVSIEIAKISGQQQLFFLGRTLFFLFFSRASEDPRNQ